MRLAGIYFEEEEYAQAASVWEEYRAAYPAGERWLESTYWAGRAEYRRGARAAAFRTFETLASRFPGSAEGSEGLFLIADLIRGRREKRM